MAPQIEYVFTNGKASSKVLPVTDAMVANSQTPTFETSYDVADVQPRVWMISTRSPAPNDASESTVTRDRQLTVSTETTRV